MEQLNINDLIGNINKAKLRKLLKENLKEGFKEKLEKSESETKANIEGFLDNIKTSNTNSINNLEKLHNILLERYEERIKGAYREICADTIDHEEQEELYTLSDTINNINKNLKLMYKIKADIEGIIGDGSFW